MKNNNLDLTKSASRKKSSREFEICVRVTIDSKCKDGDDDIIEELMYGADKYFYPYCCNNEHIVHIDSIAYIIKNEKNFI